MIELLRRCEVCEGRGTISAAPPESGGICVHCGGDGLVSSGLYFDDSGITGELTYIHTKVKKIWNKVKDGAPEE